MDLTLNVVVQVRLRNHHLFINLKVREIDELQRFVRVVRLIILRIFSLVVSGLVLALVRAEVIDPMDRATYVLKIAIQISYDYVEVQQTFWQDLLPLDFMLG